MPAPLRENNGSPSPEWACGAAGSALPWHGRGHRFDPDQVHHTVSSTCKSASYTHKSRVFPAKCVSFAPPRTQEKILRELKYAAKQSDSLIGNAVSSGKRECGTRRLNRLAVDRVRDVDWLAETRISNCSKVFRQCGQCGRDWTQVSDPLNSGGCADLCGSS